MRALVSLVALLLCVAVGPRDAQAIPMQDCDDCSIVVSLPFSFDFCCSTYTTVYLSSNGHIRFGSGFPDDDFTPSVAEFHSRGPRLAIWNDTQLLKGGVGQYTVATDHLELEFISVPNYWTGGDNTYSMSIWADGHMEIDISSLTIGDDSQPTVIVGYTCGSASSSAPQTDLSLGLNPVPDNAWNAVYQAFSSSTYDLDDTFLEFDGTVLAVCAPEDADGDGWTVDEDCDDNNAAIYPGAPELCDDLDNDCDSIPDEDINSDGDGDGSTPCDGDCDDADPDVSPDATELCNGEDDDCDGEVDEDFDEDGDGTMTCGGDCDDANPDISPVATEECDGIDNDCDGSVDEGFDKDGDDSTSCGGDCDDEDPEMSPDLPEVCDGIDNDCDGSVDEDFDEDGDGWATCAGDCDDSDPLRAPRHSEVCNGLDDDCDGSVDEGRSSPLGTGTVCAPPGADLPLLGYPTGCTAAEGRGAPVALILFAALSAPWRRRRPRRLPPA